MGYTCCLLECLGLLSVNNCLELLVVDARVTRCCSDVVACKQLCFVVVIL